MKEDDERHAQTNQGGTKTGIYYIYQRSKVGLCSNQVLTLGQKHILCLKKLLSPFSVRNRALSHVWPRKPNLHNLKINKNLSPRSNSKEDYIKRFVKKVMRKCEPSRSTQSSFLTFPWFDGQKQKNSASQLGRLAKIVKRVIYWFSIKTYWLLTSLFW